MQATSHVDLVINEVQAISVSSVPHRDNTLEQRKNTSAKAPPILRKNQPLKLRHRNREQDSTRGLGTPYTSGFLTIRIHE